MKTALHTVNSLPAPSSLWPLWWRWCTRILSTQTPVTGVGGFIYWSLKGQMSGLTNKADSKAYLSTFSVYPPRAPRPCHCSLTSNIPLCSLQQEDASSSTGMWLNVKVQRQPEAFPSSPCIISRSCNPYFPNCLDRARISVLNSL